MAVSAGIQSVERFTPLALSVQYNCKYLYLFIRPEQSGKSNKYHKNDFFGNFVIKMLTTIRVYVYCLYKIKLYKYFS
jgi:hypothetical protein